MAEVDLIEVTKRYGAVEACSGVNPRVPEGGFVTPPGPSGCGKSITLNTIAGLEKITAGDILMDRQHAARQWMERRVAAPHPRSWPRPVPALPPNPSLPHPATSG